MNIDQNAPLAARKDILIAAPVEKVWAIQTDFERWPDWQPDVTSLQLDGAPAVGTIFHWKAKGLGIVSTIREYEPQSRIGWTGDSLGMKAIHHWTFEPVEGGTRVTTEESISGWMARLLKLSDRHFMEKSLEASLQTLKKRVEQT